MQTVHQLLYVKSMASSATTSAVVTMLLNSCHPRPIQERQVVICQHPSHGSDGVWTEPWQSSCPSLTEALFVARHRRTPPEPRMAISWNSCSHRLYSQHCLNARMCTLRFRVCEAPFATVLRGGSLASPLPPDRFQQIHTTSVSKVVSDLQFFP